MKTGYLHFPAILSILFISNILIGGEIRLTVPPDASVFLNGDLTNQIGSERLFTFSDEGLEAGKTYTYNALVRRPAGEQLEQNITVEAGRSSYVEIDVPNWLPEGVTIARRGSLSALLDSYEKRARKFTQTEREALQGKLVEMMQHISIGRCYLSERPGTSVVGLFLGAEFKNTKGKYWLAAGIPRLKNGHPLQNPDDYYDIEPLGDTVYGGITEWLAQSKLAAVEDDAAMGIDDLTSKQSTRVRILEDSGALYYVSKTFRSDDKSAVTSACYYLVKGTGTTLQMPDGLTYDYTPQMPSGGPPLGQIVPDKRPGGYPWPRCKCKREN